MTRMKILIIKLSSLGDVLHTLPAVTEAAKAFPDLEIDWAIEESLADIPRWHVGIKHVIPIAMRRWRQTGWKCQEIKASLSLLRREKYDVVIDAQGLWKSALLSCLTKGPRHGLDRQSIRETGAHFFYHQKYFISKRQHAIHRLRELFGKVLGYSPDLAASLNYGLTLPNQDLPLELSTPYFVFLHGTTWASKLYPEVYWKQLIEWANKAGIKVVLPWGNTLEALRAKRLAQGAKNTVVPERLTLGALAVLLKKARAVVAVDTGLGHLAAALETPTVSLYGPTDPFRTGTQGLHQTHLQANFPCAPCLKRVCFYTGLSSEKPACFETLPPQKIWECLTAMSF